MPILKGNLHAHTSMSDGQRPVDEVLTRYRELGYDFVAITDHDDRVRDDYWYRIPLGDDRLIVLPGIEFDYRPLSQHVGKIVGDHETLLVLNHPARYGLSVAGVLHRLRILATAGLAIHAVEVTDTGTYQPQYDVETIHLPFSSGSPAGARVDRGARSAQPGRRPEGHQGWRLPDGFRSRRARARRPRVQLPGPRGLSAWAALGGGPRLTALVRSRRRFGPCFGTRAAGSNPSTREASRSSARDPS
jgi:PHP domain